MLSPRLRRQVFELWTMFWASGMTNPLTAIEQITYLLFLKRLQNMDDERKEKSGMRSIFGPRRNCPLRHTLEDEIGIDRRLPEDANPEEYCVGHGTCRWEYIRQSSTSRDIQTGREITAHEHLSQYVFPWLRELEQTLAETGNTENGLKETGSRMADAYFQLPPEKVDTLQRAIRTIDMLFRQVGKHSANSDLMGDIFEYLLSEIETSGKNGQFRTPRHIIRFMIQLLNPQPGQRIIDPAAGTSGFLINSIVHMRQQTTDPETVLLEWDGTPHRAYGGDPEIEQYFTGEYFTGYDNDRTMVRIGWMNMILHGIESPTIELRDSLGKGLPSSESGKYQLVLANPPFAGSVDKVDLHEARFPRNPRNNKEPITNKSELLFNWLILDLLETGGRAAVIVAEGVLFGSTAAHKRLRRDLILDHRLEAVISLPPGLFQPYSGVKTSILVFQKIGIECKPGDQPHTDQVWFYEIAADGYTLDAKRTQRPTPNDLWDAGDRWLSKTTDSSTYMQPHFYTVRWRTVDEATVQMFPELAPEQDQERGIHELFPELPRDPDEATAQVIASQEPVIKELYQRFLTLGDEEAIYAAMSRTTSTQKRKAAEDVFDKRLRGLGTLFNNAMRQMLESGYDDWGRKTLSPLLEEARKAVTPIIAERVAAILDPIFQLPSTHSSDGTTSTEWESEVQTIVREFAKLDGYNVLLRTPHVHPQDGEKNAPKSWVVPVRIFAHRDDWQSADGLVQGTHDEAGKVRPEYISDLSLYNLDGTVKPEYLDSDCIEAKDFNLSAGRHKPLAEQHIHHDPPADIIRALQNLEDLIQSGLVSLLSMLEGVE